MPLLDDRGRLFGRVNVVDAGGLLFLVLLLPIGYGTWLLFRPSQPMIESVERFEVSREELRLAGGGLPISAKLKVRGSGLNPMLRASIGDKPALAFVFETPNSADVLVGAVPPGTHDLVLFAGVQEVARAKHAVTLERPSRVQVRLVGRFLDLEPALSTAMEAAQKSGAQADAIILTLGPAGPARDRMQIGGRATDLPLPGRLEREAVVNVRCDPQVGSGPCTVGGITLHDPMSGVVWLSTAAGLAMLAIDDVLPVTAPGRARIRVRLTGGAELESVRAGDRDAFLDERAAVIVDVSSRVSASGGSVLPVTLDLGLDASREGWRYRGLLVKPGSLFTLDTARYMATGTVESIAVVDEGKP